MAHPLVEQLRFTRSEWQRGLREVSAEDAARRFEPINTIGWIVGHLAWHEQLYWLQHAQGITVAPEVEQCASRLPACNPPVGDMWAAWDKITAAADPHLDMLTSETLLTFHVVDGKAVAESIGSRLLRMTYHYWYHQGEAQAIRQLLGHSDLPAFIGRIGREAPYRPE